MIKYPHVLKYCLVISRSVLLSWLIWEIFLLFTFTMYGTLNLDAWVKLAMVGQLTK